MRSSPAQSLRRFCGRIPLELYLGTIAAITVALTTALSMKAHGDGVAGEMLVALALLIAIAASQLAVGMVNWLATLLVAPRPLPRMDFSHGIPPQSRTLVVVPTMLAGEEDIEGLADALEVAFLANRDDHLHFALLTDFQDAPAETMPEDEPRLALARKRIEGLNQKYERVDAFFLFHRPRLWNPRERAWMGYERKRGKLADLNAFLRGGGSDRFSLVVGETSALAGVKYVITLDTDTQLPRDAARQFVGVMAHPLNRPRIDAESGLVTEGYGILQPRVSVSLPGANRSWYARLHAGDPGMDPYTRTVSDVYQDALGEGSFIGKGIYDVDAFERTLANRFPRDRILSHDLLEGCYARSGLLSDVQLYEEYPASYGADMSRRHRWIRGDWQLAGWLLSFVPGPAKRRLRSPLSALSRWKLFDNLRRSLVPAALTLLLVARMDAAAPPRAVDAGGDGRPRASGGERVRAGCPAQALRGAAAAASRGHREPCRAAGRANHADPGIPSLRGDGQSRCDRAHRMADARDAPLAPRMESVGHRGRGVGQVDVDRAGHRAVHGDRIDRFGSSGLRAGSADAHSVVPLSRHRLVDRPAPRSPRSAPHSRAGALPAKSRAQDLGFLRELRRRRRPWAASRQLPRSIPSPSSRIAPHPRTWASRSWRTSAPTTSVTSRPVNSSLARRRRSPP
jgi:hypothetical protein